MNKNQSETELLKDEIKLLKSQLFEANSIIDAIKTGSVDALVVKKDGTPQIYAMESADYTYRLLIEKFEEGALSINYDGLILYSNDYFSKLTGIPQNEITGTYFNDYFKKPYNYKSLRNIAAEGINKSDAVLSIYNKDIPVNISFTNLYPSVPAIGVIITDLTQRKKNEKALLKYQHQLEKKITELDASNASLSQFIHVVAHDLKEPIRKLMAYTTRLNTDESNSYTQSELNHIGIIKASGNRLNSLVDDLVKYSFISHKRADENVNLNDVLSNVTEDLEIIIKESNTKITSEILPVVKGSATQLHQVYLNLIANAIKYRRDTVNPEIKISATIVNTTINNKMSRFHKISFEDNGIGMDSQYIDKIFTIFQRLHLRTQYAGNGIGLAICKKVLDNHGGGIDVSSTLGKGSIFSIYLP